MSKHLTDHPLPDCKNHYTNENIYDLFMESTEETQICQNCPNLVYVDGIMSCRHIYQNDN